MIEPTISESFAPSGGSTAPTVRRGTLALAGLAVSVFSVFLLARSVDIGAAARVIARASVPELVAAMGIFLVSVVLRVAIWKILLPDRNDGSRVSAARVTPVLMIGYLGNVLLPARLGELLRSYLITRRENVPLGGVLGSVALERMIDTEMLAIMAYLAAADVGAEPWIVNGTGVVAAVGLVVSLILASTGLSPFLRLIGSAARVRPLHDSMTALVARLERFVFWSGGAHRRKAMAAAAVLSGAAWVCTAAMFWFAASSVGASLSPAGALLIMSVAALVTVIPAAPGYVGTFELAAVTVAASLGVQTDLALAMAVLAHVITLLPTAIGGAVSLAYIGGSLGSLSTAALAERQLRPAGAGADSPE